ncbi:MAG: hypothetical protein QXH92_03975 [Candidatus Aenigmatarchaeota archaeon]
MRVDVKNRLRNIYSGPSTCVVIRDDSGNPLAVAVQLGVSTSPEHIRIAKITDHDFLELLTLAGVSINTVADIINPTDLKIIDQITLKQK